MTTQSSPSLSTTAPTILGIDGGGTSTTFLLVDEFGTELAHFETGSSNYVAIGVDASEREIAEGIGRLPRTPDVISGGFAGAGRPDGLRHYRSVLERLAPGARVFTSTDAHIACVGALGDRPGVVLIAGTGSIVIVRTAAGTMVRSGGWGPFFGDDGGGLWIGREAVRRALELSETGADSDFPARVAASFGLSSVHDVIAAHTRGDIGVPDIARLAPIVFDHAERAPASGILADAAAHLRTLIERGVRLSRLEHAPVVAVGGIACQPRMRELIGVRFEPALDSPASGAISWAREQLALQTTP